MGNWGRGRQLGKEEKEKSEVTRVTVHHTKQHSLISFLAKIVLQVPHSVHTTCGRHGPHQFTKSLLQAPDFSVDVGSSSNSYASQKSLLPWLLDQEGTVCMWL